jgi:hypothetical protein
VSDQAALEKISVQVPSDVVEQLQKLADDHDRTFSAEVRRALSAHVDAELTGGRGMKLEFFTGVAVPDLRRSSPTASAPASSASSSCSWSRPRSSHLAAPRVPPLARCHPSRLRNARTSPREQIAAHAA